MDRPSDLYASARTLMVDGQVRPNKVYDGRLLDAMRTVPRDRFVPPARAAIAHSDTDVPLGHGRVLMQPMAIARLLQMALVRPQERVLVVAAATGYSAALLDACGASVVALESEPDLLARMRDNLTALAPKVEVVAGPLLDGWPQGAPYDVIVIDAAVEDVPASFARQLKPGGPQGGGRLVTVRWLDGLGLGVIAEVIGGALRFNTIFDCATPLLADFRREPGFVF